MKRIVVLTLITTFLVLCGCFSEDKKSDDKNVILNRSGEYIQIITQKDIVGGEYFIKKLSDERNISVDNEKLKIITQGENGLKIAVVSKDSFIKAGTIVFSVKQSNDNLSITEVKTEKLESAILISKTERGSSDTLLGDFDNSGEVGLSDFTAFARNYGGTYNMAHDIAPATKGTGVWSEIYSKVVKDGVVNLSDFIIFAKNYSRQKPVEEVFLSSLTINNGQIALNPVFAPTVTTYATQVQNITTSVSIYAASANPKDIITGLGQKTLNVGDNITDITIQSESGTIKVYSIKISREANQTSEEVYKDNSGNYNYTRSTFPLGGNIPGPADWTRANIFVDLMKQAEFFGSADQPWVAGIKTDENSWPLEDFGVMLFRDPYSVGNAGTYKISFYCAATPEISTNASSGVISNIVRNSTTGLVTADLTTPKQDQLFLSFRKTQGGVKNLKVLRPGYNSNQTFTNEFLNHIDRFSQIRLMETVRTNESEETTWSERQKPTDGPYGQKKRRGIAWEHCIELANTSKSDLWINIPHMADADYVRNLAKLIKSQLRPELNVYVEYSNEVWNWMFPQSHWSLKTASEPPYLSKLNYDGEKNPGYLHFRFVGEKLKECSDIFGEVFGLSEINKRVRPILAGQIVYSITYQQPLKYLADTYGEPRNYIYGVAGAAYFNMGESRMALANPTVDDVISGFDEQVNLEVPKAIELLKGFAVEYGLKMIQYEGGPDTYAPGSTGLEAKEQAQKDLRIKDIIIKYLENWYYAGGELFCWYAAGSSSWYSQYGSFGLINIPGEDVGPKVEAIDAVIAGGMSKYASGQIPTDNPKMNLNGAVAKVDFEGLVDTGANTSIGDTINVGDYTFSCTSQLAVVKALGWTEDYPSKVLHIFSYGGVMKVSRTDKKPFSLKSIRLQRPLNFDHAASVKITGYMHTRGSVETIVELPAANGRNGVVYTFPESWTGVGMKEVKFEFKELAGWKGDTRYGAIDDLEIYESLLN